LRGVPAAAGAAGGIRSSRARRASNGTLEPTRQQGQPLAGASGSKATEHMTLSPSIPWVDQTRQHEQLRTALHEAMDDVLRGGGAAVERFEADFAAYVGAKRCIGMNSGTSALHLALLACDIGPGDDVITTPVSEPSTSTAISYVGARPVFV